MMVKAPWLVAEPVSRIRAGQRSVARNANAAGREITAARVIDASRERVWQAWIDPEQICHWWRPADFTCVIHEMEVTPGGLWRFMMSGRDGVEYHRRIVYLDVVERERIVFVQVSEPRYQATVKLAPDGSGTHLTVQMIFESSTLRAKAAKECGAIHGADQILNRLVAFVADGPAKKQYA